MLIPVKQGFSENINGDRKLVSVSPAVWIDFPPYHSHNPSGIQEVQLEISRQAHNFASGWRLRAKESLNSLPDIFK